MSLNEKAHFDFQYERQGAWVVWQIDVCSQGRPIYYMHRIDVTEGVWVCVCREWESTTIEREHSFTFLYKKKKIF